MLSHHVLGLLEVECDAPPYPIVRACRKLGLRHPEDVRWSRLRRRQKAGQGWKSFFASPLRMHFLSGAAGHENNCSCGCPLLNVEGYSFVFQTGELLDYELVQCPNCWTIYWEQL
jgi:hypothetical protein